MTVDTRCNWQPEQGNSQECHEPAVYYAVTTCTEGAVGEGPVCPDHAAYLRAGGVPCQCGGILSVSEISSLGASV